MSMPLPKVFLVRHGETAWSVSGQHTGRSDIPLTPKGETLAGPLGRRLAGIAFEKVLSSPLKRASRTAELAGFEPELDADLMEWDYGEYDGRKTADIRRDQPGWDLFRDGAPGGESVEQMTARVDRVVARLKAMTGNVLVFAHGHFLRTLAARWVKQPIPFARGLLLSTGSVCTLSFDHNTEDEPAIMLWNDVGHLS